MKIVKKLLLSVIGIFALFTVIACQKDNFIDYADKLKLQNSYEGKEFVKDGIGEVTLYNAVDGDTAWFTSGGNQIKIRFTSVDTPESTGQVEAWGKAASEFTADILNSAEKLVLEAHDGKKATLDSTSTRYLGFVWYRTSSTSDFRNLNLELVQNGYSISKVTEGSIYQTEFNTAATQALSKKLHVYSKDPDPDFDYSAGAELNIKQLNENAADYLGRRVNFEAIVTRKDNNYAYVQNVVDGETYGMLIYLGYSSTLGYAFKEGYRLRIHGFVQEYNGMYQISGCLYDLFEFGSTDTKYEKFVRVLSKNADYEALSVSASDLNSGKIGQRVLVKMENLLVQNISQSSEIVGDSFAKEMTLTCVTSGTTVQLRTSALYADGVPVGESYFKNKTLKSVMGIVTIYNNIYQIKIVSISDVVL